MRDKVLLCVSAQQATAAHWHAGKIAQLNQFARDEAGLAQFREFLTAFSNVPVHVMVDAVEEDYRFETLPHTSASDRAQLVARKLKQHYRSTPYVGAWLQGREQDKRRDDRYLFAAFTNPEILADWLRVINGQEMPLAGVYLLAMVTESLTQRLQVNLPNLLIAAQHTNGLRLTFFRNRQFRLSRLTRGDSAKTTDPVRVFAGEIANTRLYLHALRTATLDEHLTVLLLDRNNDLAGVADAIINDNPSVDCVRVTREELASRLNMNPEHLASAPDALYLQLLGRQKRGANLAPAQATVGYRRYRMRRGIYAACGAVGVIAAVWMGVSAWDAYRTNGQATEVAAQVKAQEVQYQQVTREFPPTPTSGENMKRAVEIAQNLLQSSRDPLGVMAIVSRALETTPNVVVREFGWKYSTGDFDKRGSAAAAAATPPAPPAPGTPGVAPPQRSQRAFVTGEIRPFRGDYRAAIETINTLAEQIRRHPSVQEVRAVRMPLNVNSAAQLTGNTLDTRTEAGSAEFELAVVLEAPRMTREDLQALRTPLIAFAATLVASLAFVYYAGAVAERAHLRLIQEEAQLRAARSRIQNAGEERDMIGRYLTPFRQLEQAGFVGEEQRINWLDSLRTANQQANIYGVEYEISPQRPFAYAAEFNPGPLLLKESVMKLKLRLLHEEDLPRFLQALARQGGGYFAVDECVLKRTKPGEAEATAIAQPNLLAECDLSWLTAKPPSATEKKS